MIRALTESDKQQVMALVGKLPAENLFIIGDVEAYGFHSNIQQLWGQFEDETLIAVLLRFDTNYITYSEGSFDAKGFANIIASDTRKIEISGLQHIVSQIKPYIKRGIRVAHETYHAKCEKLAYDVDIETLCAVSRLQPHEYEEEVEMLKSIQLFQHGNFSVANRKREDENQTGRTYIMRNEQGVLVASASSTAENQQSAMIVGVGTRPGYERNGYATKCMEKLCGELLKEGKIVCLFYHNPAAGRIYKRLGFTDIGMWSMIRYEEK